VKFEGVFGRPKHHQIAWFLSQLKVCNVYHKIKAACYFNSAKKAAKNGSKSPPMISLTLLLPCCRVFSVGHYTGFLGHFPANHYHHLLSPAPPSHLPPWVTTKITLRPPKQPPHSAFAGCMQLCMMHLGLFRPICRPSTATTSHLLRPPTTGYHHPVLPHLKSAPWPFKERYKNSSLILNFIEFLGLI